MNITINGQPFETEHQFLIPVLLEWQAKLPYSIAINQQFIPKHEHAQTELNAGDALEILTPISGG